MGRMVNPYFNRPSWFTALTTAAVLPSGIQIGATCGLHAFCHLLWSAETFRIQLNPRSLPSSLSRQEFEAVGLSARSGDRASMLMQPGGSNYDVSILLVSVLNGRFSLLRHGQLSARAH